MAKLPTLAGLFALLLLAACAPPKPVMVQVRQPGVEVGFVGGQARADALLSAFGDICGRLDNTQVMRRVSALGFTPAISEAERRLLEGGFMAWTRPGGIGPDVVRWNPQRNLCETTGAGFGAREISAAFDRFIGGQPLAVEMRNAAFSASGLRAFAVSTGSNANFEQLIVFRLGRSAQGLPIASFFRLPMVGGAPPSVPGPTPVLRSL